MLKIFKQNPIIYKIYFFIILFIFLYLIYAQSLISMLWFCKISLIFLLVALLIDSDYLFSAVLISQGFVCLIFICELVGLVFFKYSLFNMANLYTNTADWLISIFYHVFTALVPLHILILKKKFIKNSWLFVVSIFLISSIIIYILLFIFNLPYYSSINCVTLCYNSGVLTSIIVPIYNLFKLPYFILNTIGIGIIYYLIAIGFNYILNRNKK